MKQIQTDFGGGSITEAQLEDVFHPWLPNQSAACHARLDQFFTQWFDTAYPAGGGRQQAADQPGLNAFYNDAERLHPGRADHHFAPADKIYGDADFTLSATASSGCR